MDWVKEPKYNDKTKQDRKANSFLQRHWVLRILLQTIFKDKRTFNLVKINNYLYYKVKRSFYFFNGVKNIAGKIFFIVGFTCCNLLGNDRHSSVFCTGKCTPHCNRCCAAGGGRGFITNHCSFAWTIEIKELAD